MAKKVTETAAENEVTGVCRFCCQTRVVIGAAGMTEEQITETATRQCSCEAAKVYKAKILRAETAKKHVDKLFGDKSNDFTQPDEIVDFMKHGIDEINNEYMKSMTVNMNKGLKCKIALTADDKIKVSREAKSVVEFKQ